MWLFRLLEHATNKDKPAMFTRFTCPQICGFVIGTTVCATLLIAGVVAWVVPSIDHCIGPGGDVTLLLADTHFQTLLPLNTLHMQNLVHAARVRWAPRTAVVLGDVMHGGGGSTGGNMSDAEFYALASDAKKAVGNLPTIWVPGNHDLKNFPTHRWYQEFGLYNRHHDVTGLVVYAASAYDLLAPRRACAVYAAHEWHRGDAVCQGTTAVVTGHMHYSSVAVHGSVVHTIVPTLNPWQALSNNGFDGSGEQGFALLGSDGSVDVCVVNWFTPELILLHTSVVVASLAAGATLAYHARPSTTYSRVASSSPDQRLTN